jgi:hypothetical protein
MSDKNWPARIACAVIGCAIVPASYWLLGFNFDQRGIEAFNVFFWSIAMLLIGLSCPLFD